MGVVDIKTSKNKVYFLLETEPHLRDSDEKLISNIWYYELIKMKLNPKKITGMKLLTMLSEGKLTNSESIRRCRQGFQSSNPELRGAKYNERMNHQEAVKDDLDDLDKNL
tara:strand:+ start:61 stop:390 length:330 start_codon:yes stop_codon:yes gene_type:complete